MRALAKLLQFILFEHGSRAFEVKGFAVDGELIFACVFRDVVYALNIVAMAAKRLDDKIDVYHSRIRGLKRFLRLFGGVDDLFSLRVTYLT